MIDCTIYCTSEIVDYVLGVVVARFRWIDYTAVQMCTIELVSESECETLSGSGNSPKEFKR